MNEQDLEQMRSSIEELFYFEFVTDDIPMRGFIGHFEEGNLIPHTHHTYLYTHYHFYFEYNENRVCYDGWGNSYFKFF